MFVAKVEKAVSKRDGGRKGLIWDTGECVYQLTLNVGFIDMLGVFHPSILTHARGGSTLDYLRLLALNVSPADSVACRSTHVMGLHATEFLRLRRSDSSTKSTPETKSVVERIWPTIGENHELRPNHKHVTNFARLRFMCLVPLQHVNDVTKCS
jgi:hypothetical protein